MKSKPSETPSRTHSVNIRTWHELGLEGSMLPVTITLDGDSMRPLIRRGKDRVTILPLMRDIKIGDVVLFCGGKERYVVHRVYKLREGWVRTLGDNCLNPDPWMPLEQVWGLIVRMERGGRSYRLDSEGARIWGRVWMALYPVRAMHKRGRAWAAKWIKKVLRMDKKHESA